MMHPAADIRTLLQPGRRVHLAGIGGVSMCALAEVLQGMGLVVQGSDMTDSDTVRHLRSVGIEVAIGHSAENLKGCDAVIRTAAIHDGNPEIAGAIAQGHPRIRAGAGVGRHHAGLPQRPVRVRHPRQDHHHVHVPPTSLWRRRRTPPL